MQSYLSGAQINTRRDSVQPAKQFSVYAGFGVYLKFPPKRFCAAHELRKADRADAAALSRDAAIAALHRARALGINCWLVPA